MRLLSEINADFSRTKSDNSSSDFEKTQWYIALMNELERDYGAFVLNPTEEELNADAIKIYREISASRIND